MKPVLVLRPEPGNAATAERARARGLDVRRIPLFAVRPVAWQAPDPDDFDILLLTSANAVRLGGAQLDRLRALAAMAVGQATAEAARLAGFAVSRVGEAGVAELLAGIGPDTRLLHLTGADRTAVTGTHTITPVTVYEATAIPATIPAVSAVALVHSPRAGARLASLVQDRAGLSIAAISKVAADACGTGWAAIEWVDTPDDTALLALAARLCQD